jgi:CheY-like chemotaxis protein
MSELAGKTILVVDDEPLIREIFTETFEAKGATVLGTGEPRMGAHGVPVIFVHPKNMGGVLVELMAEPGPGH